MTSVNSDNNPPCRVIHLRNVAEELRQDEILAAVSAFGPVEKIIQLKNKKQAMIEFRDLSSAINLMSAHRSNPLKISGKSLYCTYSRHQELSGDRTNKILLVTFANPLHKTLGEKLLSVVTPELVYQIFNPYGAIFKIVMVSKDAGIQALVQFMAVENATRAKAILSGYSFYAGPEYGTFTIEMQYSNLADLIVTRNTQYARNFVQTLPTETVPTKTKTSSRTSQSINPVSTGSISHANANSSLQQQLQLQQLQIQTQQQQLAILMTAMASQKLPSSISPSSPLPSNSNLPPPPSSSSSSNNNNNPSSSIPSNSSSSSSSSSTTIGIEENRGASMKRAIDEKESTENPEAKKQHTDSEKKGDPTN